jgi:hypothetical protein
VKGKAFVEKNGRLQVVFVLVPEGLGHKRYDGQENADKRTKYTHFQGMGDVLRIVKEYEHVVVFKGYEQLVCYTGD